MSDEKIYDVAVIGGGLAGLTLAVLLAKNNHSVILFEKEKYPFHKVCGEYISMESWDFLSDDIGLDLEKLGVARIDHLLLTSRSGIALNTDLDLGGFGISRYVLDNAIKQIAVRKGVEVLEECKAEEILFNNNHFSIKTNKGICISKVCCGSWGKRSNIDVKWKRPFLTQNAGRLNNYVGIKYHVTGDLAEHTIALHNFTDGYCGISKIEGDKFCLCYFMKAKNLKRSGNSIEQAEEKILSQNPYLKKIFAGITKVNELPYSISQVSLSNKKSVENHVLLVGDAAGMISPLCGNGMSMAMHGAKLAFAAVSAYLMKSISRQQMEEKYTAQRKELFGLRLKTGRFMQYIFGRNNATGLFIYLMKKSPYLTKKIIAFTHGKSF